MAKIIDITRDIANLSYYDATSNRTITMTDWIEMKKQKDKDVTELVAKLKGSLNIKYQMMHPQLKIPSFFEVSKQHPSVNAMAEAVLLSKIPVLRKDILLPEMKVVDVRVPHFSKGLIEPQMLQASLPDFELRRKNPMYLPTYSNTNFDVQALKASYLLSGLGETYLPLATELQSLAEKKYFGAYGMWGQIKRILDVLKIFEWAAHNPSMYDHSQTIKKQINPEATKVMNELSAEHPDADHETLEFLKKRAQEIALAHLTTTYLKEQSLPYKQLADKIFPLCKYWRDFKIDNSNLLVIQAKWYLACYPLPPPVNFLDFDMNSNSGLLFPGQTHGQTALSECLIASKFLRELDAASDSAFKLTKVFAKWDFLTLSQYKPKPEVYERPSDQTSLSGSTKVRNISATSMTAGLPAQMLFAFAYKMAPNFLTHLTSCSLLGWSPFHGGMDKLFRFISFNQPFSKDPKIGCLIFSDNIYLYQTIKHPKGFKRILFISLDGAKMEAVTTPYTVMIEGYRILQSFGITVAADTTEGPSARKPMFSAAGGGLPACFSNYMLQFYPLWASRGASVFGRQQIKTPGLASGVVGTGYINTSRMVHFVGALESEGINNLSQLFDMEFPERCGEIKIKETEKFLIVQKKSGIKLTIEAATSWLVKLNSSNKQELDVPDSTILRMDLLGYDLFYSEGHAFACLDKARLHNSLLFHKFLHYSKELSGDDKKDYLQQDAINIMKLIILKVLYLIGGFAYEAESHLIRQLLTQAAQNLGLDNKNFTKARDKLLSTLGDEPDDEILKSVVASINSPDIPTLNSLYDLHVANPVLVTAVGAFNDAQLRELAMKGLFSTLSAITYQSDLDLEPNQDPAIVVAAVNNKKTVISQKLLKPFHAQIVEFYQKVCPGTQVIEPKIQSLPTTYEDWTDSDFDTSAEDVEAVLISKQNPPSEAMHQLGLKTAAKMDKTVKLKSIVIETANPIRPKKAHEFTRTEIDHLTKVIFKAFFAQKLPQLNANWIDVIKSSSYDSAISPEENLSQYAKLNFPILLRRALVEPPAGTNKFDVLEFLRVTKNLPEKEFTVKSARDTDSVVMATAIFKPSSTSTWKYQIHSQKDKVVEKASKTPKVQLRVRKNSVDSKELLRTAGPTDSDLLQQRLTKLDQISRGVSTDKTLSPVDAKEVLEIYQEIDSTGQKVDLMLSILEYLIDGRKATIELEQFVKSKPADMTQVKYDRLIRERKHLSATLIEELDELMQQLKPL
nr:MAG: RNA-dependent RNA polymerase [Yunnan birna-like virus 1]